MATANNIRKVTGGLDFSFVSDLRHSLDSAFANFYDFISIPLSHPRFKREFFYGPSKDRDAPLTRSDLVLSSEEWRQSIVGKCSPFIDCDSECDNVRRLSEEALHQELAYASHLGISKYLITITGPNNANLARIINSKLHTYSLQTTLWVAIPMVSASVQSCQYRSTVGETPQPDTWKWWNTLRFLCKHDKRLNLVLEITADLPSNEEVTRWLGEPVRCLTISTSVFQTNKKGFPVLGKAHQAVIKAFARVNRDIAVIVMGNRRHTSIKHYIQYIDHLWQRIYIHNARLALNKNYLEYIDHLWQTMYSNVDVLTAYSEGFEDYLQVPLQPLMDNLDSVTYETFEKDPVKYSEYQRAIYAALLDRVPAEDKDTADPQVVMVVGAGRGPLVNATLTAAERADRKVRVYAVEKNPNAIVTLRCMKEEHWNERVTIVSCDMRDWAATEQADILVSELLGSFGDNELSPECLDGAQKFLKPDGISIPCAYTSYLVPVQSPKLYGDVCGRYRDPTKPMDSSSFEMPYVVHQLNRMPLSDVQPLFTYVHPNKAAVIDNSRYGIRTFKINMDSVLHGFTGYFDTVLYKDIILSIEPSTYSEGMVSWFPIFFPILEPMTLKSGDELVVHFWRLHNKKDVWYEWAITEPRATPVHNPNGRSYNIGL